MQNMKTSAGDLSVSPNTCIGTRKKMQMMSLFFSSVQTVFCKDISFYQQGTLWKSCVVGFFSFLFLKDGFVKAGQTKVGVMCLVVSMNFDFFPCPYYK